MIFDRKLMFCCIKVLTSSDCCCIFTVVKMVKETFMKRMVLPLGVLLFIIACGDDSSSANYQWAENGSSSEDVQELSSSSWIASNSSSSRNDVKNSSSSISEKSSSSSRRSGPDPESSSSVAVSSSSIAMSSSSRNDVSSSSSVEVSSSSAAVSSSSVAESSSSVVASSSSVELSSSSEILTDPSKIFEMRVPKRDAYTCEEKVNWGDRVFTGTFSQNDFVCTYDYDGEKGFLYVQLNPTSCGLALSLIPGYDVEKAEFYVNGKFADVSDVKYEWGGNHHVQKLWFTYKGKVFRYGQSSLGWGGRPCQGMDCLNVFESDKKTYVVNGCDEQRSIPIVCNGVNPDKQIEEQVFDFTDKFEVCEGDQRTRGND